MRRLLMVGLLVATGFLGAQGVAQAQQDPSVAYDPGPTIDITSLSDPSTGDASVTTCGTQWPPGTVITVTLATSPQTLVGTTTAGAGGAFCQSFALPCGANTGTQTATASGTTPANGTRTSSTQVTIGTCLTVGGIVVTRPITVAGVSITRQGLLAFTGSNQTNLYIGVGIALLLAGTALLIATARRRRSEVEINA